MNVERRRKDGESRGCENAVSALARFYVVLLHLAGQGTMPSPTLARTL